MDLILEYADYYALDALYPANMPRDDIYRQIASITEITLVGGYLLYLAGAGFAYEFLFDKELMNHPKFLKHQVRSEIMASMKSIPVMVLLTLPWFIAEVRGYSKTYTEFGKFGYGFEALTVVAFICFSDVNLLVSPLAAPPTHLRAATQTAPQVGHLLAIRVARLPSGGRLHPEFALSFLHHALPYPPRAVPSVVCRRQLLDHQHPRRVLLIPQ